MKHAATAYHAWPAWEPAILLPSQLALRGDHMRSPEMRLVIAIFEDALLCVSRNMGGRRRQREFAEACEWFRDERRDSPFAFRNVCDLLGLEATAVRQRIRLRTPPH